MEIQLYSDMAALVPPLAVAVARFQPSTSRATHHTWSPPSSFRRHRQPLPHHIRHRHHMHCSLSRARTKPHSPRHRTGRDETPPPPSFWPHSFASTRSGDGEAGKEEGDGGVASRSARERATREEAFFFCPAHGCRIILIIDVCLTSNIDILRV